jgi:hypothetical protein
MPPIRLSDSELDAVTAAARPIAVERRDAFLADVAQALSAHAVLGPGIVGRTCAEVQKRYFDPPDLGRGMPSKYS